MADSPLGPVERARDAGLRVLGVVIELGAHMAVLVAQLACISIVEKIVRFMFGPSQHVFFGRITLRTITDIADFVVLVWFITYGAYRVVAAHVRKPR